MEKEKLEVALKMPSGVYGKGQKVACVPTHTACVHRPPVRSLHSHLHLTFPSFWGGEIASNIVFQFNKMWFSLLCG